jgi:hypothetical protein
MPWPSNPFPGQESESVVKLTQYTIYTVLAIVRSRPTPCSRACLHPYRASGEVVRDFLAARLLRLSESAYKGFILGPYTASSVVRSICHDLPWCARTSDPRVVSPSIETSNQCQQSNAYILLVGVSFWALTAINPARTLGYTDLIHPALRLRWNGIQIHEWPR